MAFDQYLQGLSPWDPKGSLSDADADRIWNSYKLAGGGGPVNIVGSGGRNMDWSGFGSLMGRSPQAIPNGGILGGIQRMMAPTPGAAPQVPADGAMQPTIGPGAAAPAPAAPAAGFKAGMPPGGILGLLQGQSPQGLLGMLKGMGGSPLAGAMPQAGMLPGGPGNPIGPPAPTAPQLPMDINPMNQF